MFHERCSQLTVRLQIEPRGPLLIKAGERKGESSDARPERRRCDDRQAAYEPLDMMFVRTWRNDAAGQTRLVPYLPGSSLKGVLRNQAEQHARTQGAGDWVACDVFGPEACSNKPAWKQRRPEGPSAYRDACLVCRMFGHGYLASRLRMEDAYLPRNADWEMGCRDGVGIDRETGAAKPGVKYDLEVLELRDGGFETTLTLENFELWQVGLLAYVLDDLANERIAVGYGAHRGLGRVRGKVTGLELSYFGRHGQAYRQAETGQCEFRGLGQLVAAPAQYGLAEETPLTLPGLRRLEGLRVTWDLTAAQESVWAGCAEHWRKRLELSATEVSHG